MYGDDYVLILAKNDWLKPTIAPAMEQATEFAQTGMEAGVFWEFTSQTRDTWSRARRVVVPLPAVVWETRRTKTYQNC
jgi:hypothetical protein